jgi:DNA invertase Pin-like site-specific DNA recombinase
MKRVGIYCRVSTLDQHPETQLLDLRQLAGQRGWQIFGEYTDHGISGARARRPQLDRLLADVHRGKVDVVLVWAFDRMARSVQHLLEVLQALHAANVEFVSLRENVDTSGPLGRALMVIIGAIAELERSLIIERVRAGMRRAKLEGRRLGRPPLENVDADRIRADRFDRHYSLGRIARLHGISKTSVGRILRGSAAGPKGLAAQPSQVTETRRPQ